MLRYIYQAAEGIETEMKTEILRIQNLNMKRSSGCDLKNIYMNLYEGEVLGIVGVHNSGKSFLFDFLTGNQKAESGRISFYEETKDVKEWAGSGKIYRIGQQSSLVEYCSVLENIFVIRRQRQKHLWIPWLAMKKQAECCLEELGVDVSPYDKVYELSCVKRHEVELVKAYAAGAKLILIDDVTVPYTAADYGALYGVIKKLRDKGISFMISGCKLENLQRLADRCLFIVNERAVKVVENVRRKQIDEMQILLGRPERTMSKVNAGKKGGPGKQAPFFRAANVRVKNEEWNFQIGCGEIVVFADPFARRAEQLIHMLEGKASYEGSFYLAGKRVKRNCRDIQTASMSEENMIIESLEIRDNLCLSSYQRISRLGFVDPVKARTIERLFLEQYREEDGFCSDGKKLTYAEKMAVYLERLKLQRWKLLVCSNVDNVMSFELEDMMKRQFRKMAEGKRSVCICASSFEKFCDLADYFLVAGDDGKIVRFTYPQLCDYFKI